MKDAEREEEQDDDALRAREEGFFEVAGGFAFDTGLEDEGPGLGGQVMQGDSEEVGAEGGESATVRRRVVDIVVEAAVGCLDIDMTERA